MAPRLKINIPCEASSSEDQAMESTRSRWSDAEIAFVLNYADVCLAAETSYKDTVVQAFSEFAKRDMASVAINNKLKTFLVKTHGNPSATDYTASYRLFVLQGTNCVNLNSLPHEVFEELKSQRSDLGLGKVNAMHLPEQSGGQDQAAGRNIGDDPFLSESSLERSASMAEGSQKSSRKHTIYDSDGSYEDSKDDNYEVQPAKKSKPNLSARGNGGKGRRRKKTPQGLTGASTQGRVESVLPDGDATRNIQTTKRIVTTVNKKDVVDLSSPTPSLDPTTLAAEEAATISEDPVPVTDPPRAHHAHKASLRADQAPLRASQDMIAVQPQHGASLQSKTKDHSKALEAARVPTQMSALTSNPRAVAPNHGTPRLSAGDITALDMVQDLAQLVNILMWEQARSNPGLTQEIEDRLKCIRRTVERAPGQLLQKTLQDLRSADAAKKDLRALVHDLIGRREFHKDNDFPRSPDPRDLVKSWKALREHVRDALGDSFLPEALPRQVSMGYVAARMDDLARMPRAQELDTVQTFLKNLAPHLQSPLLVRAILGAFLCRWLFSGSEPMCQNVYSQKEMKLYESLLQNGRVLEVQHLDKLLFADERFQEHDLRPRAKKLLDNLGVALKTACPNAPGFLGLNDPREWSENAVKLKQTLMISPKDYHIHYCIADSLFEPSWMQAEDAEGFPLRDAEAKNKRVSACLFPALAKLEPKEFGDKPVLAEVLVSNKVFFPSSVEKLRFDPKKVIAKAVVFVS